MNHIDVNIIRGLLDKANISSRIDEDGDIVVVQAADADFKHDVVIYIIVHNNRLSFAAGAPEYEPSRDPYRLANRNNCRHSMPTAVVRANQIRMECSFLLDEEVSTEYVIQNCIRMPLGAIWNAFINLERDDEENPL
ncbi:MAG: YbjN domain-containing protein [Muribaculaceae bacterium]|jgi:hypothetical protein